jgi:small-conductance mechanosensitive channel
MAHVEVHSLLTSLVIGLVLFAFFNFLISVVRRSLLNKVKSKEQTHNVKVFSLLLNYISIVMVIVAVLMNISGIGESIGLWIGFVTAALGWALQKPITGIAAWLMIIAYKPFRIGDRIVLGTIKGDVTDITLTHIFLSEIGGLIGGEETSRRLILVPNSTMFDTNIINYTKESEFTLDQVTFNISFESDLDAAKQIAMDAVNAVTGEFAERAKTPPYIRTWFIDWGIKVHVRYMSPAIRVQEISSNISEIIFREMKKNKKVKLAYPHTKVLIENKADLG